MWTARFPLRKLFDFFEEICGGDAFRVRCEYHAPAVFFNFFLLGEKRGMALYILAFYLNIGPYFFYPVDGHSVEYEYIVHRCKSREHFCALVLGDNRTRLSLSARTEVSEFTPTMRMSPWDFANARLLTWPTWRISKQPLVVTILFFSSLATLTMRCSSSSVRILFFVVICPHYIALLCVSCKSAYRNVSSEG